MPLTITAPPANLAINYYTKYLDAGGIPLLGAPGTSDAALFKLWELTMNLTARMTPSLTAAVVQSGASFITFPENVLLTDLPQYQSLRGTTTFDGRPWETVRGIGGLAVATAEEIVLDLPSNPYPSDENIALHEFAHNVFEIGLQNSNAALLNQMTASYNAAIAAGKWKDNGVLTYAGQNPVEYRAVTTQAFFDQASVFMSSSNAGVNTRGELQAYDVTIYNLLTQVFLQDAWRPGQFFGTEAGETFNLTGNRDYVLGGGGDDTFIASLGADYIEGGDGNDTIDFSNSFAESVVVNLLLGTFTNSLATGDTYFSIENVRGGGVNDTISGNAGPNNLQGGDGDDTLAGLEGNDLLGGGSGIDYLTGGPGDDTLFGEDGGDALHGQEGNDSIFGGNGDDVLVGLDGNDILEGGAGANTLIGDSGGDQLTGGADLDQIFGGADNDTLKGGATGDFLSGGEGNDTIQGEDGGDAIHGEGGNDTAFGGNGNDVLVGYDGADTLNGGADNDTIIGNDGADTMNGDGGNDLMYGGAGVDTGNGGDGDDFVAGGADGDTLHGNAGGDVLDGEAADDLLFGDDGGDNLNGNVGNDQLFGGLGNDGLVGWDGDDVLNGGPGNDFLIGDQAGGLGVRGNDAFLFLNGTGNDNIADFQAGTGFGDVIDVTAFNFGTFVALMAAATNLPGGTYIQLDADDAIFVEGVAKTAFVADDFFI